MPRLKFKRAKIKDDALFRDEFSWLSGWEPGERTGLYRQVGLDNRFIFVEKNLQCQKKKKFTDQFWSQYGFGSSILGQCGSRIRSASLENIIFPGAWTPKDSCHGLVMQNTLYISKTKRKFYHCFLLAGEV